MDNFPSDEELKKNYPAPKKIPRSIKAKIKKKKYGKPVAVVYMTRILIGIMIAVSLAFTVLATDEEVRTAVSRVVVKWFEKYDKISFEGSGEGESFENKRVDEINIGYIPSGFYIEKYINATNSKYYIFSNGVIDLTITVSLTSISEHFIDNENVKRQTLIINGNTAILSEKEGVGGKNLLFGNDNITVWINCEIENEELIKIAKNIK